MPTQLFTDEERARLERFPTEVSADDLNRFFRLTPDDVEFLRQRSSMSAWLVGGLQIGALRMLGFVPETLDDPGKWVAGFVADQLGVSASVLGRYTRRPETRREHVVAVEGHLGWRRASGGDLKALGDWLVERALEHEGARALFELGCERLRAERVVRPGVTVLERLVAQARERAVHETALRLGPQLTDERCCQLDRLLEVDGAIGMSRHAWLRNEPPSAKPVAIKDQLAKLGYLRALGADRFDVSVINPNRRAQLARSGRRATAQALAQMVPPRRYQILMAMLAEAVVAVTDEIVDLFDLALASTDRNARDALAELRDATAQAANDKVRLFIDVGRVILDPTIADTDLRPRIYDLIGAGQLAEAVEEAERLARPADGNYFDLLEARYSQVRQYTPAVLAALRFKSNRADDPLLAAVELLQGLNAQGRRGVPDDAPTAFAPRRWQPYLRRADGHVDRHHWELCVLTELRGALRGGNLWLEPSRRYADPTSYLIPPERWDRMRADTVALTGVPLSGEERLAQLGAELDDHLCRLDGALAEAGGSGVRVEEAGWWCLASTPTSGRLRCKPPTTS